MTGTLTLGLEPPDSYADLSPCGTYRYVLGRAWLARGVDDPEYQRVLWVMLNPSTADAHVDDPTIRKCIGFSRRMSLDALEVVNLYALRATDPRELRRHRDGADIVGPENDGAIVKAARRATLVITAWGDGAKHGLPDRPRRGLELLAGFPTFCLGRTQSGEPRHPLMLGYDTELEAYAAAPRPPLRAVR